MREGEEVENSGKLVMHVHFTLQSVRSFQLMFSKKRKLQFDMILSNQILF